VDSRRAFFRFFLLRVVVIVTFRFIDVDSSDDAMRRDVGSFSLPEEVIERSSDLLLCFVPWGFLGAARLALEIEVLVLPYGFLSFGIAEYADTDGIYL